MNKAVILIGLIVLLFWGSFGMSTVRAAAQVAKSAAKISADHVLYNDESRQIEVRGHVVITYKDTVIKADYALLDQDLNAMLAKGNIELSTKDEHFTGERLLYYFNSRQGWMGPVHCEITDSDVKEPVKLTAEEAYIKGEELLVKNSYLTGCDREKPHYHFTAQQVDYIPEERIVLYKVWYWEGQVRLLYFPKVSISLKDEDENGFELPEIGHNDIDGWWLKWGYNYFFNAKNQGRIYLDKLSQKSSDGLGVTHYFKPTATSQWYQDYYYQDNSDLNYPKNDFRLGFGYKNWTHPKLNYETNLTNRHRYTSNGDLELEKIYNFYLHGTSPWPNLKLYYRENDEHYNQQKDTFREMRFSNDWSYYTGNSFAVNTSANWYSTEYLKQNNASQQFIYSLNATKSWEKSNLRLYYNNARITSGDYFSRNYLPELTYTISSLTLPLIKDVQSTFQYTNMENVQVTDGEVSSKDTGVRWAADLTKVNNLWKNSTNKWNINLTHQLRYRLFDIEYDSGVTETSDITAFTESFNAGYRFTQRFSTTLGVGYTQKAGPENNDFFNKGDNFLPGGFLNNIWTWSGSTLQANLTARYSFYSKKPEPAYLNAFWSPDPQKYVRLATEYDWEYGLGQSNLNITYNPNQNWRLNLGLGYNPRNETWTQKEFQAFITQRLNSKLTVEIASVYDIFQNSFGVANTALVYNWHCRDFKFYYDYLEKEYWVMISFKAFPQASFKLSSNPDDLYNWYLN